MPSSSRVTVEDEATIDRSSRRGTSLPAVRATEARSFQVAKLISGSSCSAMASSGPGVTSGRLSARARSFCSSMAWRTAGMPPRRICSATGSCSGLQGGERRIAERRRRGRSPRIVTSTRLPTTGPGRTVALPGRSALRSPPAGGGPGSGAGILPRPPARARIFARPPAGALAPGPTVGRTPGTVAGAVAVVAVALGLGGQHDVDVGAPLGCPDDLDAPGALAVALDLHRQERRHRGPVQRGLDLGSEYGAHGRALGHQRPVHGSPGLLGPGGAPRPGGVPGLTGEFDFDAMSHTGRQATAVADPEGTESPGQA